MRKILRASKDAYVTDKVVRGERAETANTGLASSLNIFKLYGITFSGSNPNIELSRAFIKFDLDPLRDLVSDGLLDIANSSFRCKLKLFDVDGGQTVPRNFTMTVNPLSRSFDEGLGKDIVLYSDVDSCNFLTGSRSQGTWVLSGANSGGANGSTVDYLTSFSSTFLTVTQSFVEGTEDMNVDVTTIVSATLAGIIPDEGFRLSLTSSHETDSRTYFVKRFASRHAFDSTFHPRLDVMFDDSVQDDTALLRAGSTSTMFLHAFSNGVAANLSSGSTTVTGSNSLLLRMQTPVSGATLTLTFTGSQHRIGSTFATGIYSASVLVPESAAINEKFRVSGSILFTPIWGSLDGTVAFLTGSRVRVYKPDRGSSHSNDSMTVSITNLNSEYFSDDIAHLRLCAFDPLASTNVVSKFSVEATGLIIRDAHYSVRDVESGNVAIDFDTQCNSTRVSSDAQGMFFKVDMANLDAGRTYVIDVLLNANGLRRTFKNASSTFRVKS